jgi:hypothetical protein
VSKPTDRLQLAQRESLRLERLGGRRMTKQVLIGGLVGLGLVSLIVYSVGPSPKLPAILGALITVCLSLIITVALVRRRRLGISPLWSLSVQDRRTLKASLRRCEQLTDPRLAAAAVEHIRVAERSFRFSLYALALFVAAQTILWTEGGPDTASFYLAHWNSPVLSSGLAPSRLTT